MRLLSFLPFDGPSTQPLCWVFFGQLWPVVFFVVAWSVIGPMPVPNIWSPMLATNVSLRVFHFALAMPGEAFYITW